MIFANVCSVRGGAIVDVADTNSCANLNNLNPNTEWNKKSEYWTHGTTSLAVELGCQVHFGTWQTHGVWNTAWKNCPWTSFSVKSKNVYIDCSTLRRKKSVETPNFKQNTQTIRVLHQAKGLATIKIKPNFACQAISQKLAPRHIPTRQSFHPSDMREGRNTRGETTVRTQTSPCQKYKGSFCRW